MGIYEPIQAAGVPDVTARVSDSIEEKQASLRSVTWEITDVRVRAGAGDDVVTSGWTLAPSGEKPDTTAERIDCAEGDDKVFEPDATDLVEAACELVDYSGRGVPRRATPSRRSSSETTGRARQPVLRCRVLAPLPGKGRAGRRGDPARVLGALQLELVYRDAPSRPRCG